MSTEAFFNDYFAAICRGDRRAAFEAVDAAREQNVDIHTLYIDVFQKALREVGRLWQNNQLSVAQEHLATAITESAMLRLYLAEETGSGDGPTLIAACAETERHEVGLRMLCDLLDREGWNTVFLGPSVPVDGLIAMVAERAPEAIALSAAIAPHIPQVKHTIERLRAAGGDRQPFILVGGRAFNHAPDLVPAVGADATAADAVEGVRMLRERFQ